MKVLLVFAAVLAAICAYNAYDDDHYAYGRLGRFNGFLGLRRFNNGYFRGNAYGDGHYLAAPLNFFHFNGLYYGNYLGQCHHDGFYYKDTDSFYICSNGVAHVQRCAPGSINSNNHYVYGQHYKYSDFCDVNLNDNRLNDNYY